MKEPTAGELDVGGTKECKSVSSYAWRCEISPFFWWHLPEGGQPNAFHRFTQRIFLGLKWERINE